MGRRSSKLMVRVYMAEFPYTIGKPKEQSKWAYRLLNMVLEREYSRFCGPACVDRDENGKPYLLGYPGIHFNLSHSGCYAACAIGEKPVGIDVECWKKRKGQDRVAEKFHPLEREAYMAAQENERERLFHELWVLKEGFMKAEGSGLGIPLNSFYMDGICRKTGIVKQTRSNKSYYYKLYGMQDRGFSLAACSQEASFAEEPIWLNLQNSSN